MPSISWSVTAAVTRPSLSKVTVPSGTSPSGIGLPPRSPPTSFHFPCSALGVVLASSALPLGTPSATTSTAIMLQTHLIDRLLSQNQRPDGIRAIDPVAYPAGVSLSPDFSS